MGTALGIGIGIPFTRRSGGGAANTARTQAFLTATGITDATIISALNAMDTSLISAGLLPSGTGAGKIKALYPIVGGTASTHKYNFVDPRDLDAAFRLTFFGGITHNSSGFAGNGTNGYANTFFNPNTQGTTLQTYGVYTSTNTAGGSDGDMGSNDPLNNWILLRSGSNLYSVNQAGQAITAKITSGLNVAGRLTSTSMNAYNNGVIVGSDATLSSSLANLDMFICALNNAGSASFFTSKPYGFVFIGNGFTDTDQTNFYNSVSTFLTAIGR